MEAHRTPSTHSEFSAYNGRAESNETPYVELVAPLPGAALRKVCTLSLGEWADLLSPADARSAPSEPQGDHE